MDDRRFDSLTRAFASGASRRSVLKGLFGLGGAAVVGNAVLEEDTDAARRPTPSPTPIRCPGKQTPINGVCQCPAGLSKCGPDCCNASVSKPGPTYSECCDNACCFGHCYGEELCCPYPRTWCEATGECCPIDLPYCCGTDGCCATPCCDTTGGLACCEGDTPKCCPEDICVPAGACCSATDCGPGNCWSCVDHVCVSDQEKCAGCLDCVQGTCAANNQNCADTDPCTSSSCNNDGSCTPATRDCRIAGCGCVGSDGCHVATCNQNTGQCVEEFNCSTPGCCVPSNMCFQSVCDPDGDVCRETLYCANDELTEAEADSCCEDYGNPDPACLYVSGSACTDICPPGLGFVQADNGCCFKVYCDCCTEYEELGYVDFADCLSSCEFSPG